jgi:hypothetical protein
VFRLPAVLRRRRLFELARLSGLRALNEPSYVKYHANHLRPRQAGGGPCASEKSAKIIDHIGLLIDASGARRSGRILATSLVSLDALSKRCGALPPRDPITRNRLHRSCTSDFDRFFYFIFNDFHVIGAPGEIRTPDHLVRSQVLYPAELRAQTVSVTSATPFGNSFADFLLHRR